jgi:glutamate 5-kinase
VSCEEIERLVQCRVVSGGMVLKLEAAKRAIEGGVREVRIVGGTGPDALLLASRSGENHRHREVANAQVVKGAPGTLIIREPRNSAQTALSAA